MQTDSLLLRPLTREAGLRLIRVCKEDEGVSICAAMSMAEKRALLLIQYTGFLDSINAIRSAGCEYKMPVCIMAGLLAKEPGVPPTQAKSLGLRIVEPILDAMLIPHALMEDAGDERHIRPAIDKAYASSYPTALLIGRQM